MLNYYQFNYGVEGEAEEMRDLYDKLFGTSDKVIHHEKPKEVHILKSKKPIKKHEEPSHKKDKDEDSDDLWYKLFGQK